jgi:hypothetical protein
MLVACPVTEQIILIVKLAHVRPIDNLTKAPKHVIAYLDILILVVEIVY